MEQNEITLEGLREGKFTIKDIPRGEADRLWKEEYESLPEGAKEVADTFNWKSEPFLRGQKNKDESPKEFKDWKEFSGSVKRNLKATTERNGHLTKEKLEANAEIDRLKAQIENMSKLQKMQLTRELTKEKTLVNSEISQARAEGNVDVFEEAKKRKDQIELEEKTLEEFETKPKAIPLTPEQIRFRATNPWFENNRKMTRFAEGESMALGREQPNLTHAQHLQMIEDAVKVEFPEYFQEEEEKGQTVDSGRSAGKISLKSSDVSFSSMSQDEQDRVERMIKKGIIKSKAEFMREYNEKRKNK